MPRTKKITNSDSKKKVVASAKSSTTKKVLPKKAVTGLTMKVYDIKGNEKSTLPLSESIFGVKANSQLLAQYTRMYLANQRQGTASTKTRGEVTGSTRKIYRQKGTGKARHGSIKAPIFVGGGVVGGPKPRDYSLQMNKKQKRQALLLALTIKQKEGSLIGLEKEASKIEPKTKIVTQFTKVVYPQGNGLLFVLPKMEKNNFVLASRNIPFVTLAEATSLNAFEVLKAKKIVLFEDSLAVFEKHFSSHEN